MVSKTVKRGMLEAPYIIALAGLKPARVTYGPGPARDLRAPQPWYFGLCVKFINKAN
jgi:hypothetical protein